MSIADNLMRIKLFLPEHIRLVAVSKNHTPNEISDAYCAGQQIFGENRAQEMASKHPLLPQDLEWHFVGHLQSNKVKFIAPFVSMIQSVDSPKLLAEIDKEAKKNHRCIDCLLQFHIATEETKFGFNLAEAESMLGNLKLSALNNIRICGVMGMATFTNDFQLIRKEFVLLRKIYETLKGNYFAPDPSFRELSMGMSSDYQIAIDEGSTMVRIGTAIFGERIKN